MSEQAPVGDLSGGPAGDAVPLPDAGSGERARRRHLQRRRAREQLLMALVILMALVLTVFLLLSQWLGGGSSQVVPTSLGAGPAVTAAAI